MEQIKLEIQKLYKALDKLETRCDKIKNLKADQNAKDNTDIKKEFLNLRNKVSTKVPLGHETISESSGCEDGCVTKVISEFIRL